MSVMFTEELDRLKLELARAQEQQHAVERRQQELASKLSLARQQKEEAEAHAAQLEREVQGQRREIQAAIRRAQGFEAFEAKLGEIATGQADVRSAVARLTEIYESVIELGRAVDAG
jgi:chromosome segregation ATPase